MSHSNAADNLEQLEARVDDLLRAYERVSSENTALREQMSALSRKNSTTRQRLQAVIERLKSLEEEAEALTP